MTKNQLTIEKMSADLFLVLILLELEKERICIFTDRGTKIRNKNDLKCARETLFCTAHRFNISGNNVCDNILKLGIGLESLVAESYTLHM